MKTGKEIYQNRANHKNIPIIIGDIKKMLNATIENRQTIMRISLFLSNAISFIQFSIALFLSKFIGVINLTTVSL